MKQAGQAFTRGIRQKVADLESRGVNYDADKVWDAGVPVTPDIVKILKSLATGMSAK